MKKIKIVALVLAVSITSSSAVFAAENNSNIKESSASVESLQSTSDSNKNVIEQSGKVDELVENKIQTRGVSVPTSKWTLANGSYSYNISTFDSNIRTNYYFITSTEKIKVSTNFKPAGSSSSSYNVKVVLYKVTAGVSTKVTSSSVTSNGSDSVTFTGLSSSSNYYISFEKTIDGVSLKGSGVISQ